MRNTEVGLRAVAIVGLAVLASGCASINDHRGYLIDPALTESVQPGVDNRLSVERALGQPTFKSQFGKQTWYYVSIDTKQAPFTRPRTQGEKIIRIDFDPKGNVETVQQGGMEKVVRIEPNGDKTPTLGRDRSFFEDLFGNIGAVGALPGGGAGQQTGPAGSGPNGS